MHGKWGGNKHDNGAESTGLGTVLVSSYPRFAASSERSTITWVSRQMASLAEHSANSPVTA